MAWNGLLLTDDGQEALNLAQLSNKISFKSIVIGDGAKPENLKAMKSLVHQLYEITELKIDITEHGCNLTADFPRVDYDYFFREIGVIVTTDGGDKLYVYDNCGDGAQYIFSDSGTGINRKRIRISLNISGVSEITVVNPSLLYVTYEDFKNVSDELENKVDWNDISEITAEELALWYEGLDGEADNGIPNEEIELMYSTDIFYDTDTGISNEEIEEMYE